MSENAKKIAELDRQFQESIKDDPVSQALENLLQSADAVGCIVLMVGDGHQVRLQSFGRGAICSHMLTLSREAYQLLQQLCELHGIDLGGETVNVPLTTVPLSPGGGGKH